MALTEPPVRPDLAFVKTPVWEQAEPATEEGFAELVEALGRACTEVALPEIFGEWTDAHRALMQRAAWRALSDPITSRAKDQLSAPHAGARSRSGMRITAVDYLTALDWRAALDAGLEQLFERFDAIITPAAPGEAPKGIGHRQSDLQRPVDACAACPP